MDRYLISTIEELLKSLSEEELFYHLRKQDHLISIEEAHKKCRGFCLLIYFEMYSLIKQRRKTNSFELYTGMQHGLYNVCVFICWLIA